MSIEIFRTHVGDYLTSQAVHRILRHHHNKKVKQKTLDFYRSGWMTFNKRKKSGGETLFLVALTDKNQVVGISACAIPRKSNKCWFSTTVVHEDFRKKGIGKALLGGKLACLRKLYRKHTLLTFVNKTNSPAISLCGSSGLFLVGKTVDDSLETPKVFYTFSNKVNYE